MRCGVGSISRLELTSKPTTTITATRIYEPVRARAGSGSSLRLDVHFKGVFFLTQKLLPLLADGGSIVNVSSGLTRLTFPQRAAYASVKGAVEVLTRYLAAELGPHGIAVNTIAPSVVAADFGGGALRNNPDLAARIASITVLGRAAVADDFGPAIASIVGANNHWVTGQRIEVSGGQHV
jgi:NAD(P)-dependent dehydrogenase (short-subunit alcohol dehydrogenase family)